jgi:hypothetical protein
MVMLMTARWLPTQKRILSINKADCRIFIFDNGNFYRLFCSGGDWGWQAGAGAPVRKLFFQPSLDNLYDFS